MINPPRTLGLQGVRKIGRTAKGVPLAEHGGAVTLGPDKCASLHTNVRNCTLCMCQIARVASLRMPAEGRRQLPKDNASLARAMSGPC